MSAIAPRPNDHHDLHAAWLHLQSVGGLPIVATSTEQAAAAIVAAATGSQGGMHVHLASAQTVALAARHPDIDAAITSGGWVLPDGKPITWVSWFRHDRPRLRQTRGFDVFSRVCDTGRRAGLRHFLLGSTPEVLADMRSNMERRYGGIDIVGEFSPPFRVATAEELDERDQLIARSGAQVVWVGLGTPKQDHEAARLASTLPVLAVAVGAVFDFSAGRLKVAPAWMSAIGFEWLFRLLSEPRRLWRRYTKDSLSFVLASLRWGRRSRQLVRR